MHSMHSTAVATSTIPWLTRNYSTQTVDVTPAIAKVILEMHNNKNRAINPKRVSQWRRALERGTWDLNGATISFDRNLELVDGQHRLRACIDEGKGFRVVVVTGLDPKARLTVDIGKPRHVGDIIEMGGVKHGIIVAATVRALHRIRGMHGKDTPTGSRYNPSLDMQCPEHVAQIAHDEGQVLEWAIKAVRGISTKWIPNGSAAALFIEFAYESSIAAATEFFDGIRVGAGLHESDPRLALRNRLSASASVLYQGNRKSGVRPLNRVDMKERLMIHSWNRWISGEKAIYRQGVYITTLNKSDNERSSVYPTIMGAIA